jgi:uncharacterized membrane protein
VLRHTIRRPAMLSALVGAVALAAVAAASGGAAAKPRTPALGFGPRVLPAIDLGSGAGRRARPPAGVSNASLLFEKGNRGQTVGAYYDDQGAFHGFLRSPTGAITTLDAPGAASTQGTVPIAINDRGQIVGLALDGQGGGRGFLYERGAFTPVDAPGAATHTGPRDINNRGQMVGSYRDAAGGSHGFLRERNGAVTILPDAPGADPMMGGTVPTSINDRGQIVGGAFDGRGGSRGFQLERGVLRMIDGAPNAVYTRAIDIDNRGRIVGDYATKPPADAERKETR